MMQVSSLQGQFSRFGASFEIPAKKNSLLKVGPALHTLHESGLFDGGFDVVISAKALTLSGNSVAEDSRIRQQLMADEIVFTEHKANVPGSTRQPAASIDLSQLPWKPATSGSGQLLARMWRTEGICLQVA